MAVLAAAFCLSACAPSAIGITGPGRDAVAARPPAPDDAAVTPPGQTTGNTYAPSTAPVTNEEGRYYGQP